MTDRKDTTLRIVPQQEALRNQRAALHSMLATEEEYKDLTDYIDIDTQMADNLSEEFLDIFGGVSKAAPKAIMAVLQLDLQGHSVSGIARHIGIEEAQVRSMRASEAYRTAKEEVLRGVVVGARKFMEVASLKAVKTLVNCLDSNNEKIKLSAAQDILNRSGLSAPQHIELTTNVNNFENFTTEQLEEILKKDKVIARKSEVIEVVSEQIGTE